MEEALYDAAVMRLGRHRRDDRVSDENTILNSPPKKKWKPMAPKCLKPGLMQETNV